jgi:hypothetical protein
MIKLFKSLHLLFLHGLLVSYLLIDDVHADEESSHESWVDSGFESYSCSALLCGEDATKSKNSEKVTDNETKEKFSISSFAYL